MHLKITASKNSTQNTSEDAILLTKKIQDIQDARISAKKFLEKQAEKILPLSSVKYPAAN